MALHLLWTRLCGGSSLTNSIHICFCSTDTSPSFNQILKILKYHLEKKNLARGPVHLRGPPLPPPQIWTLPPKINFFYVSDDFGAETIFFFCMKKVLGLIKFKKIYTSLKTSINWPVGLGNFNKLSRRVRNVQKLPHRASANFICYFKVTRLLIWMVFKIFACKFSPSLIILR